MAEALRGIVATIAADAASAITEVAESLAHAATSVAQDVQASTASTSWSAALLASPIFPVGLFCSLLCCLGGLAAFLVLNHQEIQHSNAKKLAGSGGELKTPPLPATEPVLVKVPDSGLERILQQEDAGKVPTPAPDTPTAQSRGPAYPRLDSEDGNSSQRIDRLSSGRLAEALLVEGPMGTSFRRASVANNTDMERGALTAAVPDGERNYVWDDGSEYFGEWKDGQANGRGVFSWPSGDRYEGEWQDGRESGVGTYIAKDGSTFYGFWADGRMHGEGLYKPATAHNQRAEVMFMREYQNGELKKETVLRVKDYDYHRKELKRDVRARRHEKRQAAREMQEPPRPGETIYKGHRSYDLMRNLQMGILFSIAKTNKEVSGRNLNPTPTDFKTQVTQQFPRSGQSTSFKWKDYCPMVFHRLREAFGIDNRDYLLSLTGDKALRELPSPGKSGSVFYISDDDRFMIKTVRKEEMRMLLDLMPTYYNHCISNPDTLLTRFYGVHRVKPMSGSHVRFVIMGNVFPTETQLHRKFDLKGSTLGRTAGAKANEPNTTLKDLDVDMRLQLKHINYEVLMEQICADAAILEKLHVMDYSLLLGIHYVDWGNNWFPPRTDHVLNRGSSGEMEPPTPLHGTRTWGAEFASAEENARKLSPNKNVFFNTWRERRDAGEEGPVSPTASQAAGDLAENGRALSNIAESSQPDPEPHSPASSTTTSRSGMQPYAGGSVDGLDAMVARDAVTIQHPSSSWPTRSPQRPSRFALEKQGLMAGGNAAASPESKQKPQSSPFAMTGNRPLEEVTTRPPPVLASIMKRGSGRLDVPPNTPVVGSDVHGAHVRGMSDLSMTATTPRVDFEDGQGGGETAHTPQFLQLLTTVKEREGRSLDIGRTRSGWLRGGEELTSLRSLHSEQRRHMGVSIPALAFPLNAAGEADLTAKPEPVTLFFGIIDFLQDYNMRKRTEHLFKSMVQDGRAISVTNPHTYATRFCRHMQTLFIPQP